MLTMTPAAFAALLGSLNLANPITLLLLAEAGTRAATVGSTPAEQARADFERRLEALNKAAAA
jgi:hypothetical protein